MKRAIAVLTAVLILALLGGCGKNIKNDIAENPSDWASASVSDTSGTSSDKDDTSLPSVSASEQSVSGSGSGTGIDPLPSSPNDTGVSDTSKPTESEDSPTEDYTKPQVYLMTDKSDGNIRVSVRIRRNSGIAGMLIGVNYDESLVTPVSIQKSKIKVTSNLQQKDAVLHGTVTAVYANENGFDNDCEMFYILFKPIGTGNAEFSISADANSFVDQNGNYVKVDVLEPVKVKL